MLSVSGFDNYKKALEKFKIHDSSDSHQEAKLKWNSLKYPSVKEQLSSKMAQIQTTRCAGLLKQLEAMRFLLRQGMALSGGEEGEGNLPQLLSCWSAENEMISLMGRTVLRKVIASIKKPSAFHHSR